MVFINQLKLKHKMYIPRESGKNVINRFLGGKQMIDNGLKNIIVLKNLPSNIVEEAIVVLKGNKIKLPEHIENKKETGKKNDTKDYILKEAEMVILNYISNIENKKQSNNKKIEKRYKRLKFISIGLLIALIVVIVF